METAILIQARMGSTRLPGKILKYIGDKTLLNHVFDNCRLSGIDTFTIVPENEDFRGMPYNVIYGDSTDLIDRYLTAAKELGLTYVIRITADCPFIDPETIRFIYQCGITSKCDYFSNCMDKCIDGKEVEFISVRLLEKLNEEMKGEDREHVTSFIRKNPKWLSENKFNFGNYQQMLPFHQIQKMSVDTEEDLERMREIYVRNKKET